MRRRAWVLSLLAAGLLGGVLAAAPAASADVAVYPGVRDLVRRADGRYPAGGTDVRTVTPDGRFALIASMSDGLVADDANGVLDTYVVDTASGTADRISGTAGGRPAAMTPDGRWVAWRGPTSWLLTDRFTRSVYPLPDGEVAGLSDDGTKVLFGAPARARPDHPSGGRNWYLFDRTTRRSVAVDHNPWGNPAEWGSTGATLSGDGTTAVFITDDPVFDPVHLDGSNVALVRWRAGASAPEVLAVRTSFSLPAVDATGDVVTVDSPTGGLLRTPEGLTELGGGPLRLTPNGRWILLRDPDGQLRRFDRTTGEHLLVTADETGAPLDGQLLGASLSADGAAAAFTSSADGVVAGTPPGAHTYVRDLVAGTTALVCCDLSSPSRTSDQPWVSFGGKRVVFASAQQLDPDDAGADQDAFVWDRLRFHVGTGQGREGDGSIEVPVDLDETRSRSTRLSWRVQGATSADIAASSGSVVVPAGTTHAVVVVPIVDDDRHEGTESYPLLVSGGGTEAGSVTIIDDDPPPEVSVAATHVAEDAGQPMTWTVSLSSPSGLPVTVSWWSFQDTSAPSDRRAAPDKDFKPAAGTITFAPGETTKTVSSLVFDDSFFERDEWFVVELFGPTGATLGRAKATGTINDDESARFWALFR